MKSLLERVCMGGVLFCALGAFAQSPVWTGSWATAPMQAPVGEVASGEQGTTLRNVVHLSIGGKAIRLRLSNEYGTKPLTISEVSVARPATQGAVTADQSVTFGGARTIDIPAGTVALSDPISMQVASFADLAVSVYVTPSANAVLTYHAASIATNYTAPGDQVSSPTLHDASKNVNWYVLTGIDVDAGAGASSIVTLGASVVNGTHSTNDRNRRWPDDLAQRLHGSAATAQMGVLNEGIGGNRIMHDNTGLAGIARLNRDVLSQSNAKTVIFAMGTNDIGRTFFPTDPTEKGITTEQMEWATRQVVWRAHARGMRVICATLNPYEGAAYYNADGERIRQAFNTFVLSSHTCDGTVDFDHATSDPAHPSRILPKYDSGDHLHPNDAGYQAMADAFNLSVFLP